MIDIDAQILDANFLKVIQDIDDLVTEEYEICTGKKPEFTVFDKAKTGDQIGESLEKEEEIAQSFMKHYKKRPSRELADAFRKAHEIPTFERVSAVKETEVVDNPNIGDLGDLYSSYPAEMVDEQTQ